MNEADAVTPEEHVSSDELEGQRGEPLPDREVMSLISPTDPIVDPVLPYESPDDQPV